MNTHTMNPNTMNTITFPETHWDRAARQHDTFRKLTPKLVRVAGLMKFGRPNAALDKALALDSTMRYYLTEFGNWQTLSQWEAIVSRISFCAKHNRDAQPNGNRFSYFDFNMEGWHTSRMGNAINMIQQLVKMV